MDRNTISLIGIVDALKHIVDHDAAIRKSKNSRAASKRLEAIRRELLTEGLKYAQIVGAAHDSIFEVAEQLQGRFAECRGMQWVLDGLQSANRLDVDPPPLPSSSSSTGPQLAPEVIKLAGALLEIASTRSVPGIAAATVTRLTKSAGVKPSPARNGQPLPR